MKLALIICGLFFFVSDSAFAVSCATSGPARIVKDYDTVFVAFITEGHFVEGEEAEDCGWIEGAFDVAEELKGNSGSVAAIRMKLENCNGLRVGGASDSFPIGKYILVATNSEIAHFGLCTTAWDDYGSSCLVDAIQRHLDIEAQNIQMREWCLEDEKSRGKLSRAKAIRRDINHLEFERSSIESELKELREELAQYELLEEQL